MQSTGGSENSRRILFLSEREKKNSKVQDEAAQLVVMFSQFQIFTYEKTRALTGLNRFFVLISFEQLN